MVKREHVIEDNQANTRIRSPGKTINLRGVAGAVTRIQLDAGIAMSSSYSPEKYNYYQRFYRKENHPARRNHDCRIHVSCHAGTAELLEEQNPIIKVANMPARP